MRVLITGGAGFLGSQLVRACLGNGWNVSIISRPENRLDKINEFLGNVAVFPSCNDTAGVIEIMHQAKPDLVFHLASVFIAQHRSDDILNLIQSNITFGTQILEAMTICGVPHIINTGTSWQHFENQDYNPVNLYASTKQAFEDILVYYVKAFSISAITLHLFDTYGPADPRPKLFRLFQKYAQNGQVLEMSPGEQLIDLVHVDDIVDAFLVAARRLLAGKEQEHRVYSVSSGSPVQLKELVQIYQRITGHHLAVKWGGRPYRDREVMVPWSTGSQLPGWKPMRSLEEGIRSLKENNQENE
jgi:nucleoside-diphosphate-sugar epimerase